MIFRHLLIHKSNDNDIFQVRLVSQQKTFFSLQILQHKSDANPNRQGKIENDSMKLLMRFQVEAKIYSLHLLLFVNQSNHELASKGCLSVSITSSSFVITPSFLFFISFS